MPGEAPNQGFAAAGRRWIGGEIGLFRSAPVPRGTQRTASTPSQATSPCLCPDLSPCSRARCTWRAARPAGRCTAREAWRRLVAGCAHRSHRRRPLGRGSETAPSPREPAGSGSHGYMEDMGHFGKPLPEGLGLTSAFSHGLQAEKGRSGAEHGAEGRPAGMWGDQEV